MPVTPKDERNEAKVPPESGERDVWSEDQTRHQYYYDDAHGYEKYVENDDDDEKKDDE